MPHIYRNSVIKVNRISGGRTCYSSNMWDSNKALKKLRIEAGFKTAAAAIKAHGFVDSTYRSHENTQTPVPVDAAELYAKKFRLRSAGWILTGEGGDQPNLFVKVMGRIGAGGEINPEYEQVPPEGLEEIELPFAVAENTVAFEVVGDSMAPRYDPGAIIVCSSNDLDPEQMIGQEVAVRTDGGKRYLKFLTRGDHSGYFTLRSVNFTTAPITNVRIVWVGEILCSIPARRGKKLVKTNIPNGYLK